MSDKEPGQVAYESRFEGKIKPRGITPWEDQTDEIRSMWARIEGDVISGVIPVYDAIIANFNEREKAYSAAIIASTAKVAELRTKLAAARNSFTKAEIVGALGCFRPAALGAQQSEQSVVACMVQVIAAVTYRLAEITIAPPETEVGERVRHVKRGTEYEVLFRGASLEISREHPGSAYDQTSDPRLYEGANLVVYRDKDGKLWAREESEFDDGRFVPAARAAAPQPKREG